MQQAALKGMLIMPQLEMLHSMHQEVCVMQLDETMQRITSLQPSQQTNTAQQEGEAITAQLGREIMHVSEEVRLGSQIGGLLLHGLKPSAMQWKVALHTGRI